MQIINETLDKNLITQITSDRLYYIKRRVKILLSYIYDYIYSIVLFFSIERKALRKESTKKYYISVCSVFKDEAKFFNEWIEYHLMIGVDHFYLYNNFSSDNYKEILKPYIESGVVTLIEWPYEKAQIAAFENCYENHKDETFWLTFIDVDEFFCPYYNDSLKEWIRKYEKYPSLLVYWKMFGTSGKLHHCNDNYVIEQYTESWEKCYSIGKQLLNTAFTPFKIYHHYMYVKVKLFGLVFLIPSINEFYHFIKYPKVNIVDKNFTIQLNHYWSKAYDEFISKRNKGDVFYGKDAQTRTFDIFMNFEKRNKSIDIKIKRFLIRFKLYVESKAKTNI